MEPMVLRPEKNLDLIYLNRSKSRFEDFRFAFSEWKTLKQLRCLFAIEHRFPGHVARNSTGTEDDATCSDRWFANALKGLSKYVASSFHLKILILERNPVNMCQH